MGVGGKHQLQGLLLTSHIFLTILEQMSYAESDFSSEMIFLPGFFLLVRKKNNNMRNLHVIQSNFPFPLLPVFLSLVLKTLISLPAF